MVVKISVAFGVALTALAWILVVPYSPEAVQISMESAAKSYRELGLLPASGRTILSSAIGHDVFEVPDEDARQLEEAMASMGMEMDMEMDMEMGSSDSMTMEAMDKDEHDEEGGKADGGADGKMDMASDSAMTMSPEAHANMAGMKEENHGEVAEQGHVGGSDGKMDMASDSAMTMSPEAHANMAGMKEEDHGEVAEQGHVGGAGLKFITSSNAKVDRTIEIGMTEWGYDIEHAMVMKGETVRLVVSNNGNMPHEFMLMSMAGMKAVNYRIQRADWNLLEHEALFEVPIMMPGDTAEAVFKVEESGMWMFMCMFPYHMQLGMMGMMMTPDRMGMMSAM